MADGLNRVTLLGNLGADPELRHTQGGAAVLTLRLAISESYLDRDKQRKERTEWVTVVVWGLRADGLSRILSKGSRVCVEGSLRTTSYEKNGEKRYKTEVNANNVVLCGGGPGKQDQQGQSRGQRRDYVADLPVNGPTDEELPF